jgi:hypothetical protein
LLTLTCDSLTQGVRFYAANQRDYAAVLRMNAASNLPDDTEAENKFFNQRHIGSSSRSLAIVSIR